MQTRVFLAVVTLLAAPAIAPAGDKFSSSMNQPTLGSMALPTLTAPFSAAWTNGTSNGKTKFSSNCKLQVKLKGMTLADSDPLVAGDEVICIVDFDENGSFSLVVRGEVEGGALKISLDLAPELGTFCGGGHIRHNLRSTCYEPDAAYAPAFTLPFMSDTTQGLTSGYAPRPATGLIATDSVRLQ